MHANDPASTGRRLLYICSPRTAGQVRPQQATDDDAPARDIPAAFAPLEYLVGEWKGQGIPKDNSAQQFRGWPEKHAWAWIFAKGKPTAASFTIEGGKILASGQLTFDPERKVYRLEGKEADARHGDRVRGQVR